MAGYLDGGVAIDRLVSAIAVEYYRAADRGKREALRPVMDVIERAAPGVVRLARAEGGAGFAIRLAERPFPGEYEAQLRAAAERVLGRAPGGEVANAVLEPEPEGPGFWSQLFRRVRRLFSAST